MVYDETARNLAALEQAASHLSNAANGLRAEVERMALERAVRRPAEPGNPEEHRLQYWAQEIPEVIAGYEKASRKSKWRGDLSQFIVIVGSVGVTVATGAMGVAGPLGWTAAGLSFTVASTAGLSAYFKFRERAANARRAADAIDRENTAATLGIGRYRGLSTKDVLAMLVEEVERLREEQRQREQQLEQRPEPRHDERAVPG
jgi:hypothetical protein